MIEQNTKRPYNNIAKTSIIAVIIVLFIIISVIGLETIESNNIVPIVNQTPSANQLNTEAQTIQAEYKNGIYTQVGEYISPGGAETIGVTVTLTKGIISEVEVFSQANRPTTKKKQADFIANYKPMVVGKRIDEVNLTKVSGSSLTPKGFQDALEKIKIEAKS